MVFSIISNNSMGDIERDLLHATGMQDTASGLTLSPYGLRHGSDNHRDVGAIQIGRTAVRCASCTETKREIDQIWLDGRTLGDTLRSYTLQRQEDWRIWCVVSPTLKCSFFWSIKATWKRLILHAFLLSSAVLHVCCTFQCLQIITVSSLLCHKAFKASQH